MMADGSGHPALVHRLWIGVLLLLTNALACSLSVADEPNKTNFSHPGGVTEILIPKKTANLPTVRYGLTEPAILNEATHWRVLLGISLKQLPGDYVLYVRQFGEDETAEFKKFQVAHKSYKVSSQASSKFIRLPSYDKLTTLGFNNSQPPSLPMQLPFRANWDVHFGQKIISRSRKTVKLQNYTFAKATENTLIRAPQMGIVSNIIQDKDTKTVILDHGRGIFSLIHNISSLSVELGNGVSAGAVIGKVPSNLVKPRNTASDGRIKTTVYWQVQLNGVFINPLIMTQL